MLLDEGDSSGNSKTAVATDGKLSVTATLPGNFARETRVSLSQEESGDITITWKAGDEIELLLLQGENKIARTVALQASNISSNGKTATFEVAIPDNLTGDRFDLYGVYGGGGLLESDPSIAVLPLEPGEAESLASVQQRKDAMLVFGEKEIPVSNPSVSTILQHVGSLFSITLKNSSDSELNHVSEVRLVAREDGWAYNAGTGGNGYNLVTGEFLGPDGPDKYIAFNAPESTIQSGEATTLWGWYPSRPGLAWPRLELQVRNSAGEIIRSSGNTLPPVDTSQPGKSFRFEAEWNGEELLFSNGEFHSGIDERTLTLRGLAKKAMEEVYLKHEAQARASFTPHMEITEKVTMDGYERWHLKYRLDDEEHGYAYLLIPSDVLENNTKTPLIMCPHPTYYGGKDRVVGVYDDEPGTAHEADLRETRMYAVHLVKRGFVTFAPDKPAYGERRVNIESTDYLEEQRQYTRKIGVKYPGWSLNGKTVYDLKVALDYLVEFPFVDTSAIASIGHSLGSWDTLLFTGFDDRITVAVGSSGGMLRFDERLWRDSYYLEDYLKGNSKSNLYVNTNIFHMLIAPRPFLSVFSLSDPGYSDDVPQLIEGYRDVYSYYRIANGSDKADFSYYLNSAGHAYPVPIQNLIYNWLEERLK